MSDRFTYCDHCGTVTIHAVSGSGKRKICLECPPKSEQPEFVGFNFMGDIIEHFKDAEKAYQSALMNGFSVKQAEEIRIEVENKEIRKKA